MIQENLVVFQYPLTANNAQILLLQFIKFISIDLQS